MSGNAVFSAPRTQVGVAKEATEGVAVPATFWLPVKTFEADPKVTQLVDAGWRGSMVDNYGMQNGPQNAELAITGDVFCDSIGWLLGNILGDVVGTGTTPISHAMAVKNSGSGQPTSHTWTDNQGGVGGRQYAGTKVTDLTLKYDVSGLLTFDAKCLSWVGGVVTAGAASYTTLVPVPSWLGTLAVAGSAANNIQSGEISFKRNNAKAIFTQGAQDPYTIHVGELEVTTKATWVAKDESPVVDYLAGTTKAFLATFTQSANQSLAIQMTQHHYDTAKITRGQAYIEVETTGKAIANITDVGATAGQSPVLVTLKNAVAAATYQ